MVTTEAIKSFGNLIAERFSPEKIILFGSYAYGRPNQDSDVDLLVIMPHEGNAREAAVIVKNSLPRPFPLDLLVRSSEEVRVRITRNDFFMREILDRGTILYERGN